jgi:hypothetical protein
LIERGRLLVFSLAASAGYTLTYYFNWPLIIYYPVVNELHVVRQGPADGFPIFYYGWLATAVVIGGVAVWVTTRRWARRLPLDLGWIVPIVMLIAALTYEKRWF